MASRYFTDNPDRKITAGNGPKGGSVGTTPAITFKEGFKTTLPGKAQPRNRSLGVKKVKIYNSSNGL